MPLAVVDEFAGLDVGDAVRVVPWRGAEEQPSRRQIRPRIEIHRDAPGRSRRYFIVELQDRVEVDIPFHRADLDAQRSFHEPCGFTVGKHFGEAAEAPEFAGITDA